MNDMIQPLQATIEQAWDKRTELSPSSASAEIKQSVADVLAQLDSGKLRVAEKKDGDWVVHQWVKKAVLLSFRLRDNEIMQGGHTHYFDKVDSKSIEWCLRPPRGTARTSRRTWC
jgi:2,3,4,5-tetrahydropyridine-2,6-dicarboxylate N-succinyltransferase